MDSTITAMSILPKALKGLRLYEDKCFKYFKGFLSVYLFTKDHSLQECVRRIVVAFS